MIYLIDLISFLNFEYILEIFIQAILFVFFVWEPKNKRTAVIGFVIFSFVWAMVYGLFPDAKRWIVVLSSVAASVIYIAVKEKRNCVKKVILSVLWYSVYTQCVCIGNSIFYKVNRFICAIAQVRFDYIVSTMPSDIMEQIKTTQLLYFIPFIIYIASVYFILFICLKAIKTLTRFTNYENTEIPILLLPAVMGDIFSVMFFDIAVLSEKNTELIYDRFPQLIFIIPIISIFILAAVIIQIFLVNRTKLLDTERKNKLIITNQFNMLKEHIAETEKLYGGIRGLKHDITNHIENLRILLKNNNFSQAEAYIEKMQHTAEKFDYKINTGNPVTDVVINRKNMIMEDKNISFKCSFIFYDSYVNSFDMGIILDNILDNAIEAAREYVYLKSYIIKNCFFIEVENDYEGEICFNKGKIVTSKKNGREHGFGLENVKRTAEKYRGNIDITTDNHIFKIVIMLQINTD